MKTIFKLIGFLMLALSAAAGTNLLDNINVKTNANFSNNVTIGGTLNVTGVITGLGSGITGVSLGTNGVSAIGGHTTNLNLASPVITNATAFSSNASPALTLTNGTPGTNLYVQHNGGTNQNMDQFFVAGTEIFDSGIWDATNKVWALRDIGSGVNAFSVSNGNESAVFGGNVTMPSNLYLPGTAYVYAGANQLLFTAGTANFFAGVSAGNPSLSSAAYNVGIGKSSMIGVTGGTYNTGVGSTALTALTTGGHNVAVGANSLAALIGGTGNTAVGFFSLDAITTGVNNIAFGNGSGQTHTIGDSFNIDIGNTGTAGDSYIIRIGTSGTQTDAYLAGTLHAGAVLATNGSAVAAAMLTLSNNYVPSDLYADIQGQSSQVDRLRFLIAGTTNWQVVASSNTWSLLDSNGVAAVTVTNQTHDIVLNGNLYSLSNIVNPTIASASGSTATATHYSASATGLTETWTNAGGYMKLIYNMATGNGVNYSIFNFGGLGPANYFWETLTKSNTVVLADLNGVPAVTISNITDTIILAGSLSTPGSLAAGGSVTGLNGGFFTQSNSASPSVYGLLVAAATASPGVSGSGEILHVTGNGWADEAAMANGGNYNFEVNGDGALQNTGIYQQTAYIFPSSGPNYTFDVAPMNFTMTSNQQNFIAVNCSNANILIEYPIIQGAGYANTAASATNMGWSYRQGGILGNSNTMQLFGTRVDGTDSNTLTICSIGHPAVGPGGQTNFLVPPGASWAMWSEGTNMLYRIMYPLTGSQPTNGSIFTYTGGAGYSWVNSLETTATNRGAIAASGWTNNTGVDCIAYITSGTAINVTNIDGSGNPYMTNLTITITSPYTIYVQPGGKVQTTAAAGFYHAQ